MCKLTRRVLIVNEHQGSDGCSTPSQFADVARTFLLGFVAQLKLFPVQDSHLYNVFNSPFAYQAYNNEQSK